MAAPSISPRMSGRSRADFPSRSNSKAFCIAGFGVVETAETALLIMLYFVSALGYLRAGPPECSSTFGLFTSLDA
jgi:hypothetical protein